MKAAAIAVVAAFALFTPVTAQASPAGSYPGTTCNLFPADNILNTDISTLPVNTQSAQWMSNMTQNSNLHPDLGTTALQYGIPINVAPPPTTGVMPTFLYNSDSDHPTEGYPIDQNTLIEGGPGAPSISDRHALVVSKSNSKLYEIFNLQNFTNGQTPSAGSGATWDLSSNTMRPLGFTSADAAGLPIAPLLLRSDEIQAGSITHAIRLTAHCTSMSYIWPASHQAGSSNAACPPMGVRFRLRGSYDISSFSAASQVVLRAFQHYGLILADNGADWFFGGTTDDWWGTATGSQLVAELKTVPASQFDAVDESGLQVAAGSYQTGPHCSSAVMSANPASQQSVGGTVMVGAASSGCTNPRYQFWTQAPGGSWTIAQAYSASTTFSWATTGLTAGLYHLSAWVRDAASSAAYDAFAPGIPYTLLGTTCASVGAAAAPASPQAAGTVVSITATSGCPNPRYEFWIQAPGGSWTIAQAYSSGNTFNWATAGLSAGIYKYSVWVRDATSAAAYDSYFPGTAYTLTTITCTGVTASATPASPQDAGTMITLSATASGCPNPRYEFWVQAPGGSWTVVQAYSSGNSFAWNTVPPAGIYKYSVWVRDAASAAAYDSYFPGTTFTLTTTPCSGVTASATPASPQTAGTAITITATASGCPNPRFEFWIQAPGGGWTIAQAYSNSNSFSWNTMPPAGVYKYSVWVRDASSGASYDTYFPGTSYRLT